MLNHVLIIPDGNRRYAEQKDIDPKVVYKWISDNTTTEIIRFFVVQKKIKELSIFAISRNNVLNRKKEHLQDIYDAQTTLYEEWAKNKSFAKAGIKFNFIGDFSLIPSAYRKAAEKLQKESMDRKNHLCNLLVAYDGQQEIIEAVKKAKNSLVADSKQFFKFLQIRTPIDLVIRTGKEKRFSGCPLYQTSYSEFIFADYHYPELTIEKLEEIVREYDNRNRRFDV